jgi:hypothetical protein
MAQPSQEQRMKLRKLAGGVALVCAPLTTPLNAQSQAQQPHTQQQGTEQQKTQTFVGQVVKAKNGQYALLTDKQTGKGFYLDDQDKAKQFEGQNVKVTGTLEVASNTIHVSDIQPA